jgi:ribosome biogenesis GTPase / thiamine phosphate phosphatase
LRLLNVRRSFGLSVRTLRPGKRKTATLRRSDTVGARHAASGQREDFPVLIQDLGWDAYFEALWNETGREGCVPARVVSQQRGLWRVTGDFAECWAEPSGKLRKDSQAGGDWPAVGDWVSVELHAGQANAAIQQVLPRRSRFARKVAGKEITEQVIVANIDLALIVAALDGDFNVRRIERYMTQCWESGARPAIVLNKADACDKSGELLAEIEGIAMGVPVFLISATTGDGLDVLEASFGKGQTIVLLGSSGVGKSTLVNRLLGDERQATHAVRQSDSRGRHTTTSRELFVLPSGAMIIDTPGLRELQLWNAEDGLSQTFADIDELTAQCRFTDCQHEKEPGCAVQAAIAGGILDADRLESWRKLQREQEFLLRKINPEIGAAHNKRIKILMRQVRQKYQNRDKGKN